jgi:methionyl-tRNA synthetase
LCKIDRENCGAGASPANLRRQAAALALQRLVRQFPRVPKTFYITTAIDYTNSPPHVGHAYEKVLADVIARYHRLKGEKVFFLTGVDQHGQKVQQSAAKAGVPPSEFVKGITQKFVDLWKKLDVKYDEWAETIDPRHKKVVQGMLQRLYDEKQIYKDKQSGYYSVRQEQFLTDKERGPDGEFGPEWGQVEFREEENYYFKLEQHKQWLLDLIDKRKEKPFVIPDFRETELRNAVEKLSGDLCISRPKSRLSWGIELPFDHDYVNYVWFDALSNYISFVGYDPSISNFNSQSPRFLEKWPALHIIGKDIMIPAHGIYWPIMLHALGFPDEAMPQLLVHGWWNISGAKMSKSLGNIVDPNALADKYGAEALRYYLINNIVIGKDADFGELELSLGNNSTLAGVIGNLVNRSLNMAIQFRKGALQRVLAGDVPEGVGSSELRMLAEVEVKNAPRYFEKEMGKFRSDSAFVVGTSLAVFCNRLIEITSPWKLAKDEREQKRLDAVLYHLAEAVRIIGILISAVVPNAAHGIFDQLNWKTELSGKEERFSLKDAEWGKLPDGHVVGKPVPLFPRIETN